MEIIQQNKKQNNGAMQEFIYAQDTLLCQFTFPDTEHKWIYSYKDKFAIRIPRKNPEEFIERITSAMKLAVVISIPELTYPNFTERTIKQTKIH
jgi:hypothetical protein